MYFCWAATRSWRPSHLLYQVLIAFIDHFSVETKSRKVCLELSCKNYAQTRLNLTPGLHVEGCCAFLEEPGCELANRIGSSLANLQARDHLPWRRTPLS